MSFVRFVDRRSSLVAVDGVGREGGEADGDVFGASFLGGGVADPLPRLAGDRLAGAHLDHAPLVLHLEHPLEHDRVLAEVGLPEHRLIAALGGFNIGVELGQVLVVAGLWWSSRWVLRLNLLSNRHHWLDTASAGLCGLGLYWFLSRGLMVA